MTPTPHGAVQSRLRLFLSVSATLALVCALSELVSYLLGFDNKYWKPWFIGVKFNDFLSFYPRFHYLHQARFFDFSIAWPFAYPAPAAFLYAPFLALGERLALPVFLFVSLALFVAAALRFRLAAIAAGLPRARSLALILLAIVLAFPLWFCLQRANIEIFVWLFLSLGVWAFCRQRGYTAAACFGIAGSLKIVPVLYLALLIPRRQYRQLLFGIVTALAVTLAGLAFVGPTIPAAYHGINLGLAAFQQEFLTKFDSRSAGFNHTLVGVYRRIYLPTALFGSLLHWYTVLTALIGSLLWLFHIRRLPFLNQLLALLIAAVWLVPVSFEYTLLHLYAAIACLLLARLRAPAPESTLTPFLILLAALTAPLTEFIHHGWTYGAQLQSLLLLALFLLALLRPLPSHFDEDHVQSIS